MLTPDTPLPWVAQTRKTMSGSYHGGVQSDLHRDLISTWRPDGVPTHVSLGGDWRGDWKSGNAEYIVQAANHFPEAVLLLQEACEQLDLFDMTGDQLELAKQIKALLKKLE